jgi:hypothetical protein
VGIVDALDVAAAVALAELSVVVFGDWQARSERVARAMRRFFIGVMTITPKRTAHGSSCARILLSRAVHFDKYIVTTTDDFRAHALTNRS